MHFSGLARHFSGSTNRGSNGTKRIVGGGVGRNAGGMHLTPSFHRSLLILILILLLLAALGLGAGAGCGVTHGSADLDGGGRIVLPDGTVHADAGELPSDAAVPGVCPEGAPLGDFSGKPLVEVSIDGGEPMSFLLIPSGTSAVDASVLATLGDGPHVLHTGGRDIEVRSLFGVDARLFGIPAARGVLGGDVIGALVVNVDLARSRFWLSESIDDAALRACDHVEGAPVEVELQRLGTDWVRGRVEGRDGWLGIGLGTSLGVVTEDTFAALDAGTPRPSLSGFYTPTGGGTFFSRLTAIGSYEVSGKRVSHVLTRTVPNDFLAPSPASPDGAPVLGVLPADYLKHFVLSLDAERGVLRLDGLRDDPREEPSRFFTVGIALEETDGTPVAIAAVLPGSAAADAGIVPGDTLLAIDGRAVGTIPPYERSFALGATTPDQSIEVQYGRDGAPHVVRLVTRDLLTSP